MMTSGKADRKALPPPRRRRGGAAPRGHVAPATRIETVLAEALADDRRARSGLGRGPPLRRPGRELADARPLLRDGPRRGDLPPVAIQDVYQNPTVRSLAAALRRAAPAPASGGAGRRRAAPPVGRCAYAASAGEQLLLMLGRWRSARRCLDVGLRWVWPATAPCRSYLRTAPLSAATFGGVHPSCRCWPSGC